MEQISFSDAEYSAKKKITRREKLLLEMSKSSLGRYCCAKSSLCTHCWPGAQTLPMREYVAHPPHAALVRFV